MDADDAGTGAGFTNEGLEVLHHRPIFADGSGLCSRCRHPADGERRIEENMKPTSRPDGEAAAANITQRIQDLGGWRGETLARVRQLIHDVDPDVQEEWKWMGTPVWSHDGII